MASNTAERLGRDAARRLAQTGRHPVGPGLTQSEFVRVERDYGFEFADDHRAFLAAGLPLNGPVRSGKSRQAHWPDWRDGSAADLREQLGWPVEGAIFDVRHNGLWHPSWGSRPADMREALAVARRHLVRVPVMVPVCGHRYLPAGRGTSGHPVLSIHQADIIIFGTDLADYIDREFGQGLPISEHWTPPPMVPFWSEFL